MSLLNKISKLIKNIESKKSYETKINSMNYLIKSNNLEKLKSSLYKLSLYQADVSRELDIFTSKIEKHEDDKLLKLTLMISLLGSNRDKRKNNLEELEKELQNFVNKTHPETVFKMLKIY